MPSHARYKLKSEEEAAKDPTVLLKLEELINLAMGPQGMNVVSFKLVQTVLLILARQMRLLDQQVELRQAEDAPTDDDEHDDDTKTNEDKERRKKEKAEKRAAKEERASKRDKDKGRKTEPEEDVRSVKSTKSEKTVKGGHDEDTKSIKIVKGDKGGQEDDTRSIKSAKGDKGGQGEEDTKSTKSTKGEKAGKGGHDDDTKSTKGDQAGKGAKESKSLKMKDADEDDGKPQAAAAAASDVTSIKSKKVVGRRSSVISVTERQGPGKETILVVEKSIAPSRRESVGRVGSVEVVTVEQFRQLQQVVQTLKEKAGPLPPPVMPDNQQLRDDIVQGNASLTDTMQAMQLTARVEAAEKAITHMSELLTALAAEGALPEELAAKAGELQSDVHLIKGDIAKASGGTDPKDKDVASIASKKSLVAVKSVAVHPEVTAVSATPVAVKSAAVHPEVTAVSATPVAVKSAAVHPEVTAVSATSQPQVKGGTSIKGGGAPGGGGGGAGSGGGSQGPSAGPAAAGPAAAGPAAAGARPPHVSASSMPAAVSKGEMNEALKELRNELTKSMTTVSTKAGAAADNAVAQAKAVAEKMDVALKLNNRVNALYGLVSDYNEQLVGFDAGLTTQMQGFQEQMMQLRGDLSAGLAQLEAVNSNAETAAVLELTERYNGLVNEFSGTLNKHTLLNDYQKQLSGELKSLLECVEMMREQKADRDEVMDGLRDKADLSQLAGLLTEQEFARAREELERRLEVCHEKFRRQERVWKTAIKDFADITATKAELMELMSAREHAEQQLKELHDNVHKLAVLLGDPKAAILCRKLSKDGACAVCRVPALMDTATHGGLPRLPDAWAGAGGVQRPRRDLTPDDLEIECARKWLPHDDTAEDKVHWCTRYCGGSHTIVTGPRERAPAAAPIQPATRYTGPGTDGKLYHLEQPLQPCDECNQRSSPSPSPSPAAGCNKPDSLPGEVDRHDVGAGDSVSTHLHVTLPDSAAAVGERPLGGDVPPPPPVEPPPEEGVGGTHRRSTIGNIVKGRVTVVDAEQATRAAILYEIQSQRASIIATQEGDRPPLPPTDGDQDPANH